MPATQDVVVERSGEGIPRPTVRNFQGNWAVETRFGKVRAVAPHAALGFGQAPSRLRGPATIMPFVEFIIDGMPVSNQSGNVQLKRKYREAVRAAAQDAMDGRSLFRVPVRLTLRIFHDGGLLPDNDNVAKLIQDALEGIVYADDKQIDDNHLIRRSLDEPFILRGASELVGLALTRGRPFVYVHVTTSIDRTVIK